jgi:hypothetical protein
VQESVQAKHEEDQAEDQAGGDGEFLDDGFHDVLLVEMTGSRLGALATVD